MIKHLHAFFKLINKIVDLGLFPGTSFGTSLFTRTPLKPIIFYLWSTKLPTYEDLSFVDVKTSLYTTPFIQEVEASQLGP